MVCLSPPLLCMLYVTNDGCLWEKLNNNEVCVSVCEMKKRMIHVCVRGRYCQRFCVFIYVCLCVSLFFYVIKYPPVGFIMNKLSKNLHFPWGNNCRFKSNHFSEFWFWCEYQEDGEHLSVAHFLYACLCLPRYLTAWILMLLKLQLFIYFLPHAGTHHNHQHYLSNWHIKDFFIFMFFFFFSFQFFVNLFYVLVSLLLFSLHHFSLFLSLNNFFKHLIIQIISAPTLLVERHKPSLVLIWNPSSVSGKLWLFH